MDKIKVIAFDADDTMWINEPHYQEAEKVFCELLKDYLPINDISSELLKTEMDNIEKYGYGAKGFALSMIETALRISNKTISPEAINTIINIGKDILEKPIELLDNIDYVLSELKTNYTLIIATKGDLIDQNRKINNSGLIHHFHHVEIMHDKTESEYQKLIGRLNIKNEEFLMIGNSVKSDILPVIAIGGKAIHVPFHITWQHEIADSRSTNPQYKEISKLKDLLKLL